MKVKKIHSISFSGKHRNQMSQAGILPGGRADRAGILNVQPCPSMPLVKNFDIHGGGQDLQFPHHENEIAQSCCATDKGFAKLWMHNGFVRVDDEKMSKSLDNFFTVREVLKKFQPEVIRFFIPFQPLSQPVELF